MARKTHRSPAPRLTGAQLHRPEAAPEAGSTPVKVAAEQLADEYRYVLEDLKKIGLIALGMLAFLLVLALVLV